MTQHDLTPAREMIDFIDRSPSPYHACARAAELLGAAGFGELVETDSWQAGPGRFFVRRAGSIVAWIVPDTDLAPATPFRLIGAHTDSPNLRVKPRPDRTRAGYRQLGVEVYGGALLNSWLDRDLGLSGRVYVRAEAGPEQRLFLCNRPLLRVPQLAIHLDREVNKKGLLLNKQQHMSPVWGLTASSTDGFRDFLASELAVEADEILSWEVMCHDLTPSNVIGAEAEFVAAPRLDNLCSSFTGLRALIERCDDEAALQHIPVVSLFDHEEVGSASRSGAGGALLTSLLERIALTRGAQREDFHRALAGSVCVSADMAHATHPNYVEKHEPEHFLAMNAGPVIKLNSNLRYASESETEALFQVACERADVPFQKWVNRTDLACGSTIGPLTAANLGMRTVDVGNPQLSMHSAREMCGSHDPAFMLRAMASFLEV
jgi:aspartyl aminopeptidase